MIWEFFHWQTPNMSKTALNVGLQIPTKEVHNYIAGHKYRKGAWNLPHKFHLYLIVWIKNVQTFD